MSSIEFASANYLYGLIIIPLLIVWYIFRGRKNEAYVKFSDTSFFANMRKAGEYMRVICFSPLRCVL